TRCAGLAATHLLPHRQDFDKGLLSGAEVELGKLMGISNAVAVYRHRILRGWHIAIKSRVRLDDPGYPAVEPDIRCVARLVLVVIPVDPDPSGVTRHRRDDDRTRRRYLAASCQEEEQACRHSGASGVVEHDDPQTPCTWAASSRDPYGTAEIRRLFPTMMKDKAAS